MRDVDKLRDAHDIPNKVISKARMAQQFTSTESTNLLCSTGQGQKG